MQRQLGTLCLEFEVVIRKQFSSKFRILPILGFSSGLYAIWDATSVWRNRAEMEQVLSHKA